MDIVTRRALLALVRSQKEIFQSTYATPIGSDAETYRDVSGELDQVIALLEGQKKRSVAQATCPHSEFGVWVYDHEDVAGIHYVRHCRACGIVDWKAEGASCAF